MPYLIDIAPLFLVLIQQTQVVVHHHTYVWEYQVYLNKYLTLAFCDRNYKFLSQIHRQHEHSFELQHSSFSMLRLSYKPFHNLGR